VRNYLKNWVHSTVQTYGFDGIRIDTCPEVSKDFWREYAQSAGVFQIGEVMNGDIGYVSGYQGPDKALDATLNYPLYYTIKSVFNYKQSMYQLRTNL
jgi:alpha-amylase